MKKPYAAIVFLSYESLEPGERFYGELLGFPLVEDQGWAKVYRIHDTSYVGIVESKRASMPGALGEGTLLSIVVEDVDVWYERLKTEPSIEILNAPQMVGELPVYSFFLKDPAGYAVETQAFTEPQIVARFADQLK